MSPSFMSLVEVGSPKLVHTKLFSCSEKTNKLQTLSFGKECHVLSLEKQKYSSQWVNLISRADTPPKK